MTPPPDESYSAAEAAEILRRSERQVQRYLASGRLGGSQASGRWMTTALHIWKFQGIAEDMLENWRAVCRHSEEMQKTVTDQTVPTSGE